MAIARFKDLCLDVVDAARMAKFWSRAAGLQVTTHTDGGKILTGPTSGHTIWLNDVPEPKTVKHRVHLDVRAASVAELTALGAQQVSPDGEFEWLVMSDPEGGEFCAFVSDEVADYRLFEIGVDASNPTAIADWWGQVLGANVTRGEHDFSSIDQIPGAPFDSMDFATVPEPKSVKNRIHWDVTVKNRAAIDELVARGAIILREHDDEIEWTVLADPEGNEFCAFTVVE